MIPVTGITNDIDVEFDTKEERVYWVESSVRQSCHFDDLILIDFLELN